ncbi:3-oxoacyl-[acyl-carrier protein] reductase [Labilithrix luteola]|uniref:3-oxoacyl-[acyl-carrier protein] reductase n=1 Tax=Labilithrix luteola TaxID=1391654 RepID=A0A0K1PSY8_9BACT|nr:SDR family oxidoreductase [Labilithrix luteola]AKU96653.1 3-oxoacyl-[acyl-carrier protein] reductase [Labilithrix luteola]
MARRLEGKIALVTGGTSGIGLAAAKVFHDEGARVIVTGTNPVTVEKAKLELAGVAEVLRSDAGDSAQIKELFEHVKSTYGRLDVLFLNAGMLGYGPIAPADEATIDRVLSVNFKGPWLALSAAVPLLPRGSTVVFNTSITNEMGGPTTGAYAASKAALRSLVRVAAAELADKGVRVNAVSPGPTDTGIIGKHTATKAEATSIEEGLASRIPLRRLGRPDEVARVALFLASDESSFMTGEEVVVDGGLTRV